MTMRAFSPPLTLIFFWCKNYGSLRAPPTKFKFIPSLMKHTPENTECTSLDLTVTRRRIPPINYSN